MNVSELIEQLNKLPPEMKVVVRNNHEWPCYKILEKIETMECIDANSSYEYVPTSWGSFPCNPGGPNEKQIVVIID